MMDDAQCGGNLPRFQEPWQLELGWTGRYTRFVVQGGREDVHGKEERMKRQAYQDDGTDKHQIYKEVSRAGESRRRRFQLAAVGVEEVGVQDHAQLRAGQDE